MYYVRTLWKLGQLLNLHPENTKNMFNAIINVKQKYPWLTASLIFPAGKSIIIHYFINISIDLRSIVFLNLTMLSIRTTSLSQIHFSIFEFEWN